MTLEQYNRSQAAYVELRRNTEFERRIILERPVQQNPGPQRSATAQIVQHNEVGTASFRQSIAQVHDNCNDYAEVSEHICLTSYIFDKSICRLGK